MPTSTPTNTATRIATNTRTNMLGTRSPTSTATPFCTVCNTYFADTNIACNPDGTVAWQAIVRNNADCTVYTPVKIQLTVRNGATGTFYAVYTQHINGVFPPGDTEITGTICYDFQPGQTDQQIYIREDSVETLCNADHKSPFIDICTPNPTCPPAGPAFNDVSAGSTYGVFVYGLAQQGAVSGYADGSFRPYATTTRAQLAKIVALAFGLPLNSNAEQHFSDVSPSHPYYQFIEALYSRGLINGYEDGTFRPYDNVTRQQVAKIVVVAAGYRLVTPGKQSFTDVAPGSSFYSYIETALANKILAGYPDGTFRPEALANRGQIAKLILGASTPQKATNNNGYPLDLHEGKGGLKK